MTVPLAACGCRLDGNAAFLFLFHEVGRGRAIVDLTDLMDFAGELKDTFCGGGLTGIDVGENTDISVKAKVCHFLFSKGAGSSAVVLSGSSGAHDTGGSGQKPVQSATNLLPRFHVMVFVRI